MWGRLVGTATKHRYTSCSAAGNGITYVGVGYWAGDNYGGGAAGYDAIPLPAGVQQGDLLLLFGYDGRGEDPWTPLWDGTTGVSSIGGWSAFIARAMVGYKFAGTNEPNSQILEGAWVSAGGYVVALRGVDPVTPIAASGALDGATWGHLVRPSLEIGKAGSYIFYPVQTQYGLPGWPAQITDTYPLVTTERLGYQVVAEAGTSPSVDISIGSQNNYKAGYYVVINPA